MKTVCFNPKSEEFQNIVKASGLSFFQVHFLLSNYWQNKEQLGSVLPEREVLQNLIRSGYKEFKKSTMPLTVIEALNSLYPTPIQAAPVEVQREEPIIQQNTPSNQSSDSSKLFNKQDKELKKGSVVEYNGKKYLFWNNNNGKAQLINTDGTKFSGTPNIDKLTILGSYKTVLYNNIEYIVTDNDNIYSGATGNLVYTGTDNSSQTQKNSILKAAKNSVSNSNPNSKTSDSSNNTINIFAGTNENADLSNFAIRPFIYKGIKYNTVEGAFQAEKLEYADDSQSYNNKNISTSEYKQGFSELSGNLARQQGRSIKGLDRNAWDYNSSRIMKEILLESFKQNPNALQRLLSTGNAKFTHKFRGIEQDGGRFSRLLMEVRELLKNSYTEYTVLDFSKEKQQVDNKVEIITSTYTRQSVQNDSDSMYLFTDNAQRTSRPTATVENVDKNSWYYKKYKSQTNKPIHFGSLNNPSSAVMRGLNNAYPISTMSAYGTDWTDANFDLFKTTIDDEIAQIKKDLPKFSKIKISNSRIGQGGMFASLPKQHQAYLDKKLLEIGIDNTGDKPKIVNNKTTEIYNQEISNSQNQQQTRTIFDKELAQKIQDILEKLYPELKLIITNNPIWEKGGNIHNQKEFNNQVNYRLKATEKILDNLTKIKQWESNKSIDKNTLWKKISELGIPKQQLDLLKESEGNTIEEKLVSFVANYSYTVEINTATIDAGSPHARNENEYPEFEYNGNYFARQGGYFIKATSSTFDDSEIIFTDEYFEALEKSGITATPSQYYSYLTVPGGTNYTENEIKTPNITPSIKGHAQFSTDKGIGWFRSDDKVSEQKKEFSDLLNKNKIEDADRLNELRKTKDLPTKIRRILELQSDLFQKGRNKESLIQGNIDTFEEKEFKYNNGSLNITVRSKNINRQLKLEIKIGNEWKPLDSNIFKGNTEKNEFKDFVEKEINLKKVNTTSNQFLQLLNKDNNWATFFVKSIIQDSAKKGYEKVLFPTGSTASKVEGHTTLEEFKKEKEDRIKELEDYKKVQIENDKKRQRIINKNYPLNTNLVLSDALNGVIFNGTNFILREVNWVDDSIYTERIISKDEAEKIISLGLKEKSVMPIESIDEEVSQLKQELERVEREGFGALRPIYNFYENVISNILKKQGYNPVLITDEYDNTWNEISINQVRDLAEVLLQHNEANQIIGQANTRAMTVLIDAINQKQDTLPHEYAHHYIAWYRDTPIVQEAIKKWGSEEALVQSIGEQAVKQKGEAYNWWNNFVKWIMNKFNSLSKLQKEELTQILTDAFLTRQDLSKSTESNKDAKYQQIEELFKANPELANEVYKTLGFNNYELTMDSFMPKKHWKIGHIIDNPTEAANICDNTQIRVLNYILDKFGKPKEKGTFYAKPVTIWAKSPINDKQIHHYTVAVRVNNKVYLYDMPQSEYIDYVSENKGKVIKEYKPRLIEYTPTNLQFYYGTSNENLHIQDEVILTSDLINLNQLTSQQKQQAIEVYSEYLNTLFPNSKVKEIVHHGSRGDEKIETFKSTGINKLAANVKAEDNTGIFFTDDPYIAATYGDGTFAGNYRVLLNIKNPIYPNTETVTSGSVGKYIDKYDGVIGQEPDHPGTNIVVFEPEQIHILGSKKDIEGFKKFTKNKFQNYPIFVVDSSIIETALGNVIESNGEAKKYNDNLKECM